MNIFTLNGIKISGDNVTVNGQTIVVDGKAVEGIDLSTCTLKIEVVQGSIQNLTADGNVTAQDVRGAVSAGGNVACGCVGGTVNAGGNVKCNRVGGSINAGGNVRHA